MNVKSNLTLLAEAASADVKVDTRNASNRASIVEAYSAIPNAPADVCTEASDVVVTCSDGNYYVEMTNLAPFMMDSGLKSINKALDLVAEANGLEPKSIALVIDSHRAVGLTLEAAESKSHKTNNPRILENTLTKVAKNNDLVRKLMTEGYKVVTKNKDAKVCPDCGKAKCKCECGDNKATIAECDKRSGGGYPGVANEAMLHEALKHKSEIDAAIKELDKGPTSSDQIDHIFKIVNAGLGAYGGSQMMNDDDASSAERAVGSVITIKSAHDLADAIRESPGTKEWKIAKHKELIDLIDSSIKKWKLSKKAGKHVSHAEHMIEELNKAKSDVYDRMKKL